DLCAPAPATRGGDGGWGMGDGSWFLSIPYPPSSIPHGGSMSFSIGTSGSGMGPRSALHSFGDQAENRAFEWRIVIRLLQYLKPYWQRLLVALVLTLIASALTLTTPYLVKVALDQYIVQGETSGLTTIALLTAATFVGIYIVSALQSYLLS